MAFRNPIVGGGDTLVRNAIQSEGFTLDPESNVVGWRIERDGTAYFTGVTVGNLNYTVDENGNGAFNDVSVAGTLTVGGDTLTNLLAQFPRGIIALNTLPHDTASSDGTNPVLFGKITVTNWDATRQYKFCCVGRINAGTSTPRYMQIQAYYKWDADATTADTFMFEHQLGGRDNTAGANTDWVFSCQFAGRILDPPGTDAHVSFYFMSPDAGANYQGTSYGRIWVEDIGPVVTYGTFDPGTGTAPPQQHVKTYSATWSRSWDDSGGSVHATNGELVQGFYSSSTGNRLSWIGFDYSQIQSDLSGATVNKVELFLYYDHWYNNAGGTAIIGYHNSTATSAPAFDGSKDNQNEKQVSGWGINVGKWVDITDAGAFTAAGWKDGTHTGIVLGPGPTTSHEYYGKARGNTESNEPKLRITYTK